jgi:hypothetical protein
MVLVQKIVLKLSFNLESATCCVVHRVEFRLLHFWDVVVFLAVALKVRD